MISIVVSTNRKGCRSAVIADAYLDAFNEMGVDAEIFSLSEFTPQMIDALLYNVKDDKAGFDALQEKVDQADKFMFIIPEYNGSFPGVLKLFVDCLRYPDSFQDKKAGVMGISSGTQGGALAMGHFCDILNYFGAHTLALRPRFIEIKGAISDRELVDEEYLELIRIQAEQLAEF
jgi:NAD(P)H-dependent FMN reductase